jgi:hypothetical protein
MAEAYFKGRNAGLEEAAKCLDSVGLDGYAEAIRKLEKPE